MTPAFLIGLLNTAKGAACFPACNGPYWSSIPAGTVEPYVVYFNVGVPLPAHFTDGHYIESLRIQFSVFHTDDSLAITYASNLRSQLNKATIALTSGLCLGVLTAAEPHFVPVPATEKNRDGAPMYHAAVDFRFFLSN